MCDTGYSVAGFVTDLRELARRASDEAGMVAAVPALARRLALAKHNWLRDAMRVPGAQPGTAGTFTLHEEPDHTLAVIVVTWLPGEETPPHDHGTWAVIAGLEGCETNHWWRRLDDGKRPGYAEVQRDGCVLIEPHAVVAMGARRIHSVQNDSRDLSVSLHVYGKHVDYTERSKFDPQGRTTSPYAFGATLAQKAAE